MRDFDPEYPTPTEVVIFGLTDLASLAWYYLTHDSPHQVVAFTVDKSYCSQSHFHGLPVVPFEEIHAVFPPGEYSMFLPIGWKGFNSLRAEKLEQARQKGYRLVSYVSSSAITWPDLTHGMNCGIHGVSINPFVKIGNNCLIYGGSLIGHHSVIEDHCYIAGKVTLLGRTKIGRNCILGAGCTIMDEVHVAPGCFIAAGAVVTKSTNKNGIYSGHPAIRRKIPANRFRKLM